MYCLSSVIKTLVSKEQRIDACAFIQPKCKVCLNSLIQCRNLKTLVFRHKRLQILVHRAFFLLIRLLRVHIKCLLIFSVGTVQWQFSMLNKTWDVVFIWFMRFTVWKFLVVFGSTVEILTRLSLEVPQGNFCS